MNAIPARHADPEAPKPPERLQDGPRRATLLPACGAGVPSLLSRLLAAVNAEERRCAIDEELASLGCDWLVFGTLVHASDLRPVSIFTENADLKWMRRYCAEAYFEIDPRLAQATNSSLPVPWSLEQLERSIADRPSAGRERRFIADLTATGMRGGVILVLPGEPEGRRNFVSLLARSPDRRLLAGEMIGQVLTLGLCLHEYYTRYSHSPDCLDPTISLTPVQREILNHVARGESDKRIAYHLSISSHAVDYHMRQLRSRFAVHNRVQLVRASRAVLGA